MASSARIEELRKKFEENPRRYFAPLANEYRKAGDIEQAIAICREYLPQQPGHMSGHIVYGQALFEARQVEEAKAVFETALSLDPENLIALRHLGDLALLIGDSAGARLWYGRVLEADPRNEEIQAQLASLDQPASATPTPLASASIPAAPPPVAPAKPTPSTAPTVVIQSPVKGQPWAKKAPVATPPTPVTAQSPTAEIKLDALPTPQSPAAAIKIDALPTASPRDVEKSQDMTLGLEPTSIPAAPASVAAAIVEVDVPVSASKEAPPLESFSLEGLETTSLSTPPVQSLSTAATIPIPLAEIFAAAQPASSPPPAASAPPRAAPVSEDVPLLDIGEMTSAPPAANAPAPAAAEEWIAPSVLPEPVAEAAPAAPESGPFVTETMAELYLQQGHRDEALRVYRALLEQRPNDGLLAARVAELSVPAALETAADAPDEAHSDVHYVHSGPTIRELLSAIATRRPGFRAEPPRENGAAPAGSPAGMPEDYASEPESTAPMQEYDAPSSDALSSLFGSLQIAAADEGAATALAYAFMDLDGLESGAAGAEAMGGAPARQASNELSLDAVFKGGEAAAPAAPSSFSFDQFFSQRATAEQPVQSGVQTASGGTSRDDVAQFTQWLEGLKQR